MARNYVSSLKVPQWHHADSSCNMPSTFPPADTRRTASNAKCYGHSYQNSSCLHPVFCGVNQSVIQKWNFCCLSTLISFRKGMPERPWSFGTNQSNYGKTLAENRSPHLQPLLRDHWTLQLSSFVVLREKLCIISREFTYKAIRTFLYHLRH